MASTIDFDCVYKKIQSRVDEYNKLNIWLTCVFVCGLVSFFILYFNILFKFLSSSIFFVILAVFLICVIIGLKIKIKSSRLKITNRYRIIYYLQNIKKAILVDDFSSAKAGISSCVLFLNDLIEEYKYTEFTEEIVESLVKIEAILRNYAYPIISEDSQKYPLKVSTISDYLDVASRQIYLNKLKEATMFSTKGFEEVEVPIKSVIPLSRFRIGADKLVGYTQTNPSARYIGTSLIAFIVVFGFDMALKRDLNVVKFDMLTILGISVMIATGIMSSRKSK